MAWLRYRVDLSAVNPEQLSRLKKQIHDRSDFMEFTDVNTVVYAYLNEKLDPAFLNLPPECSISPI